jgi:hypothetical protein
MAQAEACPQHLNLLLVYLVQGARLPYAGLWSVHLLFLSIPFMLKTSWLVDFVYISFAQAFLGWQLMEGAPARPGARRKHLPRGVVLTLLGISIGLSNIVTLNLIGNYRMYGTLGFIFWADLLCLTASYILLLPQLTSSPPSPHRFSLTFPGKVR